MAEAAHVPMAELPCVLHMPTGKVALRPCESSQESTCSYPLEAVAGPVAMELTPWPTRLMIGGAALSLRWLPQFSCAAQTCVELKWETQDFYAQNGTNSPDYIL